MFFVCFPLQKKRVKSWFIWLLWMFGKRRRVIFSVNIFSPNFYPMRENPLPLYKQTNNLDRLNIIIDDVKKTFFLRPEIAFIFINFTNKIVSTIFDQAKKKSLPCSMYRIFNCQFPVIQVVVYHSRHMTLATVSFGPLSPSWH